MLTPGEQKRIEEEQYRGTVRARMQQQQPGERQEPISRRWIGRALLITASGMFIIWIGFNSSSPAHSAKGKSIVFRQPVKQSVVRGQIVVNPRQCVWYRIEIPEGSTEARVAGSFNSTGGSGNDIDAAILDGDANLAHFTNGHQAHGFWRTDGAQTAAEFNVPLHPGIYYLAFSNRMSLLSRKQVFVTADLTYHR